MTTHHAAIYEAWAVNCDGTRIEYTGLRRTQALWRYHWFERQLLNNPSCRIAEYGWRLERA